MRERQKDGREWEGICEHQMIPRLRTKIDPAAFLKGFLFDGIWGIYEDEPCGGTKRRLELILLLFTAYDGQETGLSPSDCMISLFFQ